MPRNACWRAAFLRKPSVALLAFSAACLGLAATKPNHHAKVILEVVNRHFTVGQIIPSIYLRVYSDGTAECRTLKYTGHEHNVPKRQKIAAAELQSLEAALDDPGLRLLKEKYELMYPVIDSWTEWDIIVSREPRPQKIKVLDFALNIEVRDLRPAEREKNLPYPPALLKLGCLIWKVRNQVYGDETYDEKPVYLSADCKNALRSQ